MHRPKARIVLQGLVLVAGLFLSLSVSATTNLYVYELPDGSRILTDHALSNRNYRLVRVGRDVRGMGHLAASRHTQLFRADPSTYDRLIREHARRHQVDFALVKAIMHVESNFNPYAASHKGALGLMQLMPTTAQRHGITELYDPSKNIEAGVRHIHYLKGLFPNRPQLVIAAYNAGENAVIRHGGIPPYQETQQYVRKVLHFRQQYQRLTSI
jgi:soluble lytic murein transglycosylase-like protein